MTHSTSDMTTTRSGMFQSLALRILVLMAVAAAMIAVALWRDRLTPGIVIFAVAGMVMHIIRQSLTRGAPLAVLGESDALRQQILVKAVAVGGMILPVIYMATPWLDFASYRLPLWAVILGGVIYALGLWLFWRAHADLGRFWSPVLEVREGHKLVTGGVYSRIRHPMYTAIFLFFIGQPLCIYNWISGFAGLIAFTLLYLVRVNPEERMLADTFGADWEAYAARAGRLLPRR